ncbi:acyl-CoA dehydrogenase family protein [Acetobacter sp. KSO5]|uniref:acyl-CoA dehydrogenase family protein n=1 Tax=Acetobacter sp. KSO5 TaxID=3373674 RepID=UPI00376F3219
MPQSLSILSDLVSRFSSRAAASDQSGEIATDNLADLHKAGLLALTVSPRYGGGGKGLGDILPLIGTLAQGDPSTTLILAMQCLHHASIAADPRWPEDVRRMVSEAAVQDGALLNALRVEPDLGTPSRGGIPATRVSQKDGPWVLNGCKIYSTGSTALRWGIVWAATDEETPRTGHVLVPLDAPGVRIERTWDQLGMRATGSHTIHFENVVLPEAFLVDLRQPEDWRGAGQDLTLWHALLIAALYDGVARSARDWLVTFLHARVPANLGKPLASLPRFQILMGEIEALLLSNRALLADGLARYEQGQCSATDANLIKHVVTDNAIRSVEKGVAAIGNPALSRSNPLERHLRDVLCARIHTPQADTALSAAGRVRLEQP